MHSIGSARTLKNDPERFNQMVCIDGLLQGICRVESWELRVESGVEARLNFLLGWWYGETRLEQSDLACKVGYVVKLLWLNKSELSSIKWLYNFGMKLD
jgi:hypothetical protein